MLKPQIQTCDPQDLYDFIFDRLRSIRQDMVVQSVSDSIQLEILATCVRFHLIFGHHLTKLPTFSQHINSQHQLDCIKSCLLLDEASMTQEQLSGDLLSIQCLYILTNIDSPHALSWAIKREQRHRNLGK